MTQSLKKTQTRLRVNAVIVIILVILLTVTSLFFYKHVDNQWRDYSNTASNVYVLHDTLVQRLGYGGFIHHFKNLILRKNVDLYLPSIKKEIYEIKVILEKLEAVENYDKQALGGVRTTLANYEEKLDLALKMIEQGASSEAIDDIVKVDDAKALAALSDFESHVNTMLKKKSVAINENFKFAYTVHILTIVLLAGILLFYFKKLSTSYKEQQALTDRALEGARIKSEFLANMSHEIRTPLNGIMGLLQILQPNVQKPQNIEIVSKALFSCRSLLTIINDILDFSKMEANELTIENVNFSLIKIVESINSDFLPICNEKSIELNIDIDKNVENIWIGDPVRIRQIILNLVSNAVKFTEQGGIQVIVKKKVKNLIPGIELQVLDTGIGMSEEGLANLFQRFQQADNSITRRFGGTGLGMSITTNLIKRMGGTIDVDSKLGEGTRFTIFLPLEIAEQQQIIESPHITDVPNLEGKTVLIAEDNPLNTMVIQSLMAETNANVQFAKDGLEAIDLFKKINPMLVLMDIQMPKMGGIEACAHIRALNPTTPVIALTANVMKENIIEYKNCGFYCHVGKPVEKHLLFEALNNAISQHNQNLSD
ncbi:ATP-binding protein [Pseudoalteromonas sp. bablab_jr010]|uniref:ATP-binding protein n=1 Tax=Pseudoalteromonas sp. bablab_jr010 TaxID=2755063 RepID=UPI0018F72C25|nr:ATP-binding protein [Pseudoalteromonas sp. bablab_jr010]